MSCQWVSLGRLSHGRYHFIVQKVSHLTLKQHEDIVMTNMAGLHAADPDAWRIVAKEPFVEASKSPAFWRALYIPVLSAQHVHWTYQVLLSSKTVDMSGTQAIQHKIA